MLEEILDPACVAINVAAPSRKQALQRISELLCGRHGHLTEREVYQALSDRERLGSTAMGEGVAIPHCRRDCRRLCGALVRLEDPIDFDAPDGEGVDLIFALVVPEDENEQHLTVLAELASLFSDAEKTANMRAAKSAEMLRALMLEQSSPRSASR